MEELRQCKRHQVPLEVEYSHPATGTLRARARDMSDGGLFLMVDESFQLKVGTEISVRSLGLGADGYERGPDIAMKVVRRNRQGMGLAIAKGQDSQKSPTAESPNENQITTSRPQLQRLLILDDRERVLLWHRGDHWHLPCRELQANEGWEEGINTCITELKRAGAMASGSAVHCTPRPSASLPAVTAAAASNFSCPAAILSPRPVAWTTTLAPSNGWKQADWRNWAAASNRRCSIVLASGLKNLLPCKTRCGAHN